MANETVLGIDPGTYETAYCFLEDGMPGESFKVLNDVMLRDLRRPTFTLGCGHVVIETIFPRGQAVGLETMTTQLWAGRFWEAAEYRGCLVHSIDRQDVRFAICGSLDTRDSSVRQGLIDHYGGERKAIGGKRCKNCKQGNMGTAKRPLQCNQCGGSGFESERGPLYGFAADQWAALAIALGWTLRKQMRATA